MRQPEGNNTDCGVCALMCAVGTLLRVPMPGNPLSAVDRRWVVAMVLNRDMGPIVRLPSPGELPMATPPSRRPKRRWWWRTSGAKRGCRTRGCGTPCCAWRPHREGYHWLLGVPAAHRRCATTAEPARPPAVGGECPAVVAAGGPGTHPCYGAGGRGVVVLEGAGVWPCLRLDRGSLDWLEVTADRLMRWRSRGTACFGVLRDHMQSLGPVHRARRWAPEGFPSLAVVFVEVTTEPRIPGQEVWRPVQVAAMCAALRGHAAALPGVPAVKAPTNRPAASVANLHCGSLAWCWVIVVLELHSSALHLYDRGGVPERALRPADLDALHLGTLGGDGSTALYLQGTVVGAAAPRYRRSYGGDALRVVLAEDMAPWHRASLASVDYRGRPGEVRRCVAPVGGGAVSRGGDDALAATAQCATWPAGCPCGRRGEGSPESGAEAGPQERR